MFNLSFILEDSARRYATKPAISFNDAQISYAELNAQANRVANALRALAIKPGDKVALSLPNILQFPLIYFGILKAGAIVVPLNVLLKSDEIRHHLNNSDAIAYFCFSDPTALPIAQHGLEAFHNASSCKYFIGIGSSFTDFDHDILSYTALIAEQADSFETHPSGAEDTAVLVYTSGTTGQPKGAELTHINLFFNANLIADIFGTTSNDVLITVLPLFHIFGMTAVMNAGILKGAHQVLLSRFDPKAAVEIIDKYKVSIFAGVPTMYWALLHYQHPHINDSSIRDNLRLCVSGGASLPVKVLEDFQQRFNVNILEGYGMSEGSPVVTFNDLRIGCKPGSIGPAVWAVEVKVVDADGREVEDGTAGELLYKGHNVMKGYYKNPQATADTLKDGWLHSGDVAYRDADGFFFIVDRTKDMIIRGGMNVYSLEVESVLMKHPAISLVAVIGIPDERLGEEIKACIVLKANQQITADELIAWSAERLAKYKYPRIIEFVDSLPLSATGKILKRDLRAPNP